MSDLALFSNEGGRHFITSFGIYCSFHITMRQVFLNVFFYLEIVNKMQLSIAISDFQFIFKTFTEEGRFIILWIA